MMCCREDREYPIRRYSTNTCLSKKSDWGWGTKPHTETLGDSTQTQKELYRFAARMSTIFFEVSRKR